MKDPRSLFHPRGALENKSSPSSPIPVFSVPPGDSTEGGSV